VEDDVEKKNPNDYPRVMFRVNKKLETFLKERIEESQTLEKIVRRDLEAYYTALAEALPQFSELDALFICDVLNGSRITPDTIPYLRRDVIDAALEQDKQELAQRLQSLSLFEWRAVVDAVQRYWIGPYHKNSEASSEKLRSVGLVRFGDTIEVER
jgi:hypothetical protein